MSEPAHGPNGSTGRLNIITAPTVLVAALQILALVLVFAGLGQGGMVLYASPRAGGPDPVVIFEALWWMISAGAAGGLLWALGGLLRRQHEMAMAQERILRALKSGPGAAAAHPPTHPRPVSLAEAELDDFDNSAELLQRLLSETMEMNANLLMSPSQREAKGLRRQERLAGDLTEAFVAALAEHAFARAEVCIKQFEDDLPDDKRLDEMRTRLSQTREAAEARDVEAATQRASDLMAVSSFDEALQAADALLSSYPASSRAQELVDRVHRESTAFFRDQRQRLYAQVQRNADARRWGQALEAATQLVQTHPGSGEADAARAMLTTLADNARIEEVRRLRDHIRDMIKRHRYAEAVEVARDVMERFPDSQAAVDLRGQIGRLEELAAEEGP